MRTYIPFILVALALFSAACIAYIAWEVSSEKGDEQPQSSDSGDDPTDTSAS